MALQVQIRGGLHDGEYVAYMGPVLRLPAIRPYFSEETTIPMPNVQIDEYEMRRGFDREMYYVKVT
jgi:hypothetical protein